MKRQICIVSLLVFVSVAYSAEIPKYEEYFVQTVVNFDSISGIYKYNYTLINPVGNKNELWSLDIYIPKDPKGIELSWENLTYGEGYSRTSSETIKDKIIAVGIDGPSGWTYGIGYDEEGKGFVGSATLSGIEILPGSSVKGLILTSYGLPAIRDTMLQPYVDTDSLPDEYYENEELSKQLQDSLIYHTKTIGPTAPPLDFNPLSFLDYIISMKHEAFSLGWITNKGIEMSLDQKLDAARKKLSAGDTKTAKNILNALINEVEAQGCETYEGCPKGKHLTPEAYALLKYNVLYLIERL
ncbi:MAG: hypothetical protein HY805_10440 [Nitrospirae bacterium]|nr:hypothetical protein [Nitrospirota bacterium]